MQAQRAAAKPGRALLRSGTAPTLPRVLTFAFGGTAAKRPPGGRVGRGPARCPGHNRSIKVLATISLLGLAACSSPKFSVATPTGELLFEGRQGVCFIGCNVRLRRPDGVACSGFTPGLQSGRPQYIQVSCPDMPLQSLRTESWSFEQVTIGFLSLEKPLEERNRAAAEAAVNSLN